MPRNDYAAGETIQFTYRCAGPGSSANPVATILDETGAVFDTLTVGSGIELKYGRTFLVTFTPDAIGIWIVNVTDDNGGDVSKSFDVATASMAWVVSQLEAIGNALAALSLAVSNISSDGGGAHIG